MENTISFFKELCLYIFPFFFYSSIGINFESALLGTGKEPL